MKYVTIVSRNVLNVEDVDDYVKYLANKVSKPNVKKWIKTTLKKHIINNATLEKVERLPNRSPSWAKESFDNNDLYRFDPEDLDREFNRNLENVLDWMEDDDSVDGPIQFGFNQAVKKADKYREKKSQGNKDVGEVKVWKEFKSEYKIVQLIDKEAFKYEGKVMKHCVGDELQNYYKETQSGDTMIFSLRDKNDNPHATIQYNPKTYEIEQVKGKANGTIKSKYVKYIKEFINNPPKSLEIEEIDEEDLINNLEMIEENGVWYDVQTSPEKFKESEDTDAREIYYKNNPDDEDAKEDESHFIRKIYYEHNPNDEDAKDDELIVREQYYKNNPNDEDAKDDESEEIRKIYYRNNPDDEDAKDDEVVVREQYYKNNPDDEDAKEDKSTFIRKIYYQNNPKDEDAKYDKNSGIRQMYYENNPDDEDAKEDKDVMVRKTYYKNNPNDEDAKDDESEEIRKIYYKNHPYDEDAKDDEHVDIRRIYYKNNPDYKDIIDDESEEI